MLARAETPPFEIVENSNVKEDTRLKYRYLDLRRPDMQQRIIARHRIVKSARDYFDHHGFWKSRPLNLIKSTPEGARTIWCQAVYFRGILRSAPVPAAI